MKLKYIKLTFFILISLDITSCYAETFYGTLRGDKIIDFKSPVNGVVNIYSAQEGRVNGNIHIYKIDSPENEANRDANKLNLIRLKKEYNNYKIKEHTAKNNFERGFISKNELEEYSNKVHETTINIKLLEGKIKFDDALSKMCSPFIREKFIYRHLYINNSGYVNSGDYIMKIETIDKFHIDIQIDPSEIDIKSKKIKYKSLVANLSGNARIVGITASSPDNSFSGLKKVSLELDNANINPELLDTAFEVTAYD
ncbi:ABC transporter [Escherichia coli]